MKGIYVRAVFVLLAAVMVSGCGAKMQYADEPAWTEHTVGLSRNGVSLYLSCRKQENSDPERNILLIHGSAYSSHEFDVDYQDYSLVQRLVNEGYAVWRLDIAGYGRSGAVEDGLAVDTAYAAEDIHSAIEKIVQVTGQDRIDLLGWSWGTMTCSLCAAKYPEHLRRLILYAPILSGIGEGKVSEPFSHNTWESAAEDFQKNRDGTFDSDVTDPVLIELFCSNCWHYDGDFSPNGWQKDARKDRDTQLIDLDAIRLETLVICGDNDPNLNYDLIRSSVTHLPEGSELCVIPGGSHIVMYERKGYHAFQDRIVSFLNKG